MSYLAILANLGTLVSLFKTAESLVEGVVAKKAPPALTDLLPLIDEIEAVFKTGIIQIKGVDDKAVADALQMVRDQLTAATAPKA